MCTRLEGGFLGCFGKRYCINCIVVLYESNELSSEKPILKNIQKKESEIISRCSELKLEKPVNIPHQRVHIEEIQKSLNGNDKELQKALELSKKSYEEEQKAKELSKKYFEEQEKTYLKNLENQKKVQLKYPKLEDNENDDDLKRALEQSRLTFENEKIMRVSGWEDLREPNDDEKVPEIINEHFQMEVPKPIHNKSVIEPKKPNLNQDKSPEEHYLQIDNKFNIKAQAPLINDIKSPKGNYSTVLNEPPKAPPLPIQYADLEVKNPPIFNPEPQFLPPLPVLPTNLIQNLQLEEVQIIKTDPKQDYDIIKKLATGSMGTVYIAKNNSTEAHCAIKIIETNSAQEESLIINEVKLTINSHHKNIITYFKCYHFQKTFWVIEELMSCSLADLILDMPERIPERIISYILKSVLEAIHYLHSNNRLHRDIKSDNVLLSLNGEIKLGDLGFAAQLESRNQIRNTFAGTLLWMSPELLNQRPYTYKTDIWSLGIVAYELAEGEPPYYREGQQRIVVNILNQEAPRLKNEGKWSREFAAFLSKCLVKDPDLRADTRELLNEPFISRCSTSENEFREFFNEWLDNR